MLPWPKLRVGKFSRKYDKQEGFDFDFVPKAMVPELQAQVEANAGR